MELSCVGANNIEVFKKFDRNGDGIISFEEMSDVLDLIGFPKALHKRLFDATLLTWLTSVPPDRVGVSRLLRLGDTLKPTATGFDLDLSRLGQHKTSAAFGPTITAVPAPAAALLTAWLGATGRTGTSSAAQPHVFVPGTDASKPLGAPQWTKLVKAVFKTHAGVPSGFEASVHNTIRERC